MKLNIHTKIQKIKVSKKSNAEVISSAPVTSTGNNLKKLKRIFWE